MNLLIDPWLSKSGAFFGSWFQWPINHNLLPNLLADIRNSKETFIYISHEHQDHFDIETLKELRKIACKCVIPKYFDSFLYDSLISLGYEVTQVQDQKKLYFNDFDSIELLIIDTGVTHDSAAIIEIEKKIFVNQNDCKVFDRLHYLANKDVEFYAVQFSGASWHPVCYDIDQVEKQRISKKKTMSKLVAVRNALKILNPKYYLPSAGPAIFPFHDPFLSLGEDNIFVHQPKLSKFLSNSDTCVVYLKPGDTFKISSLYQPIEPPSLDLLRNLKNNLECKFDDVSDADFKSDIFKEAIQGRLNEIVGIKIAFCPNLIFKWGHNGFLVDLNELTIKNINFDGFEFDRDYMMVEASPAYFSLMSDPKNRWQDIYLSLRAKVKREPDTFNTFLNIFLFSDLSNIKLGFETTLSINDERILLINAVDGKNYEINRYCPHNGADLKNAEVDINGNVICPRHNWLFNLSNGGNCTSSEISIEACEVMETTTLCENITTRLTKI